MIPEPPITSTRVEAEQLRAFLATDVEWTADLAETLDTTADLVDESLSDRAAAPIEENKPRAASPLPIASLPKQRAFGFVAFMACALAAIIISIYQSIESSPAATSAKLPPSSPPYDVKRDVPSAEPRATDSIPETRTAQRSPGKPKSSGAGAPIGEVTFESRSFATSERSVAAVFIIRRTQGLGSGAVVKWVARSGTADAGIDFSDASGTIRFADGQKQRAIYVPLRNDLLKEGDETFKVCLRGPRQSCAEVTIRDDDGIATI